MGLPIGASGTGFSYGKGVFINLSKIIAAEDVSRTQIFRSGYVPDLAIKVTFDVGRQFTPSDYIYGVFKKDDVSGKVTGWGSAFHVSDFLSLCGIEGELDDNNGLSRQQLEGLKGKEVLRLTYVKGVSPMTGKPVYTNWDTYGEATGDPKALADRFFRSLSATGFPKNYHPEALDEDTGFNYGANVQNHDNGTPQSDDDDDPFA